MPPKIAVPKRKQGQLTASHKRAPKQEREIAAAMGGKVTLGSGNLEVKGDVRVPRVARIECKTTMNQSFSITRDIVRKIQTAAMGAGELPAVVVEFLDKKGRPVSSIAIVPTWVLSLIADFANPAIDNTKDL